MTDLKYLRRYLGLDRTQHRSKSSKTIHPENQKIKDQLKQTGITQQEVSEILRIPVSRLRKNLNSWYPMPEYFRQKLLGIIEMRETLERAR